MANFNCYPLNAKRVEGSTAEVSESIIQIQHGVLKDAVSGSTQGYMGLGKFPEWFTAGL